jgi:hypothetical protein
MAVTVTTARAASTYDGDGQVPQQFVISANKRLDVDEAAIEYPAVTTG